MEARLHFHDGPVLREGVKDLDQHGAVSADDVGVTEGRQSAVAGLIELADEALITGGRPKFLLKSLQNFKSNRFHLKGKSVLNARTKGNMFTAETAEPICRVSTPIGERLCKRASNLGKCQLAVAPGDQMTSGGDGHSADVVSPLHVSSCYHLEKLRMQWPPEDVEEKILDWWPMNQPLVKHWLPRWS